MKEIARSGAGIVGGCCGTTPEYIRAMKAESEGLPAIRITPEARRIICSGSRSVDFDTNIIIKDLEITADIDDIIDQAFELAEDSDIIRLHTPPTGKLLPDIVIALQELIKTPFAFSVRDEKEADAVLRVYNGRPLLDIFPGGQDSRLGPAAGNKFETIANKYGALVYEHNHRD
jgi:5-methyltetrahydrofolate--homocysteine methyltransferase